MSMILLDHCTTFAFFSLSQPSENPPCYYFALESGAEIGVRLGNSFSPQKPPVRPQAWTLSLSLCIAVKKSILLKLFSTSFQWLPLLNPHSFTAPQPRILFLLLLLRKRRKKKSERIESDGHGGWVCDVNSAALELTKNGG